MSAQALMGLVLLLVGIGIIAFRGPIAQFGSRVHGQPGKPLLYRRASVVNGIIIIAVGAFILYQDLQVAI